MRKQIVSEILMTMFFRILPVFYLFIVNFGESVSGANILFVNVVGSPSHQIWNEVLVGGLLEKGHKITLIGHHDAQIRSENYTVLKIAGFEEVNKQFDEHIVIYSQDDPVIAMFIVWNYITAYAELDLNSDALKTLLAYPKDAFDLIIFDMMLGQFFYPLIAHFGNPPVIGTSPFGLPPYILEAMGTEFYSYFPIYYWTYTDRMSFLQRLHNIGLYMLDCYLKRKHFHVMFEMAKKRFGDDIIQFERVGRQFQLLLANYDPTLDFPVPLPPNIIPVGGLHTKRSTTLPEDLLKILNNCEGGAIYLSFGTNVVPSWLSADEKDIMLSTFSKLKQVVLWKYHGDDLKNIPRNVIIRKWYPQNIILGHKNVKLFITHGGGLSTREAMYHGVPVIAIPFFSDQRNNAMKMQARKLGKRLLLGDMTKESLYDTIHEVLNNPIYKENIEMTSRLFRDQKETPLERAVFWVEYTLRHKNLSHFSTRSRDMNVYQRQNLDIFGFVFLCLFVLILLAFKILRLMYFTFYKSFIKIKTE